MPDRAPSPRADRARQPRRSAAVARRLLPRDSSRPDGAIRDQHRVAQHREGRRGEPPGPVYQPDGGRSAVKLVIFGLTVSSSWGNGHATLWRGLCAALARRGHRVVFLERDVPYYSETRDLWQLPGSGELILYRDWEEALRASREHLSDADVAMVTSYCPDGIAATELVLDSAAPLRVFYDLDAPVTLARIEAGEPVDYIGPRGLAD